MTSAHPSGLLPICLLTLAAAAGGEARRPDHCPRSRCSRKTFTEYPGLSYTGEYLVYRGPWPYITCQRLCRQYLECVAFVMKWTEAASEIGYCGLIGGKDVYSRLETQQGNSLFTSLRCPLVMTYDDVTDKCHTQLSDELVTWYEANRSCADLYPLFGSHLLQIRSQTDQDFLARFMEVYTVVWLGIIRTPGGSKDDIVYSPGGDTIEYSYWYSGEPNQYPASESTPPDCVAAYGSCDNQWRDAACGDEENQYICEMKPFT